jgi:DNA-binding transcriptional MocR family regulator
MTWRLIRPIWRLENVTASQRLVLLALASFADERGENAYPSQATLSRMCCCSRSTVKRALVELIARGLIAPHGKGRKGTIRYTIAVTHDVAHPGPVTRPTPGHNPINNNPSNNPSEKDNLIYAGSGGSSDYERIRQFQRLFEERQARR